MAAHDVFSRWFGSLFLGHEARAQSGLPFPHVCEKGPQVKVEVRCQLFACSMDFGDNRVFPHESFQRFCVQSSQRLGYGIDDHADVFQGNRAKQRLAVGWAEDNWGDRFFAHESS
jgi:hypothetical protein